MGSFFTNVQVKAGAGDLPRLLEAIRASARETGMVEVAGDGEADRTVRVLPPDEGGWVAVYDEATEGQDEPSLDALAATLSRALQAHAFSVLVHDSDVLRLGLFASGSLVDRFDSFPEYFGERMSKRGLAEVAGRPELWEPVIAPGRSADELETAWTAEDLFAERTLARTCEALGCDRRRACLGFRYAEPSELPPGTVTLGLRAKRRPAYQIKASGPPRLELQVPYGGVASHRLAVSDELRLPVTARNVGGASAGLLVTARGSVLDLGLCEVDAFQLLVGDVMARPAPRHVDLEPERRQAKEGGFVLLRALPDQPLPPGAAAAPFAAFGPGGDLDRAMAALHSAQVHVNVVGRVVRGGEGDLEVSLVPLASPEAAAVATYALTLDPPLPRPLRARGLDGMPGGSSHLLRPLLGDRFMVALAALGPDRSAGAALARRGIESALEVLGTRGQAYVGTFHREPARRPGTSEGKVTTLLRGARLDALERSMVAELTVEVTARDGPAFDPETGPRPAAWGASFGTSVLPDREESRAPTLVLWADAATAGPVRTATLRLRWSELLERAVEAGGSQAVLLRSGWPGDHAVHETPYEVVCRIPHGIATARPWVERWLRVPGNDLLWLGPTLAARLASDARARLAEIADVVPLGDALRVTLRAPSSSVALELALEDLLPTEEECHASWVAWRAGQPRE